MQPPHCDKSGGWLALWGFCAAAIVLWGLVLPWVATWPSMASRIERNAARGIDPSAKFYSELEGFSSREAEFRGRESSRFTIAR